jgi:hypothetical protein
LQLREKANPLEKAVIPVPEGKKLLTCVWPKPRFTNSVLAIPEAGSVATYAKSIPPCGLLKIDMSPPMTVTAPGVVMKNVFNC